MDSSFTKMAWLFSCNNRNRGIIRMNFDEAALLWQSVERTAGPILEIGRRHGGSTVMLCSAGNGRVITSIDLAPKHHPKCDEFFNTDEARRRVDLIIGNSRVPLSGRRFGLLFIDGDHSYEGVRLDTVAHWAELVSMDGKPPLAVFHDAVPNNGLAYEDAINHCPGVERLCAELIALGAAEKVESAGSLLVVKKTAELSDDFVRLAIPTTSGQQGSAKKPLGQRVYAALSRRIRKSS
jgi:hypothetical protein